MLSRRNLRVKVMQFIYAHERGAFNNVPAAKKALLQNVNQTYEAGLYIIYYAYRIARYAEREGNMKAGKHLPSAEDLNFNTRLANNEVVREMETDRAFKTELEKFNLHLTDMDDADRKFFRDFAATKEYQEYLAIPDPTVKDHAKALKTLFNKVLLPSDMFTQHLEEQYSNWIDDQQVITFRINDFFDHYAIGKSLSKIADLNIELDDREFVVELFQFTLDNQAQYSTLIEPKLENWDMERIAILDMILMKMALCELLYFPMIPVKVTINEYIEIAKLYSTPKSKDFVNGILDKIMKELKESGAIKKSGRGLQG